MCCLMYEHRTYVEARRRFPREGRTLRTSQGEEKVVSVDIWQDLVTLKSHDGDRRTVALEELKEEVGGPPNLRGGSDGTDENGKGAKE